MRGIEGKKRMREEKEWKKPRETGLKLRETGLKKKEIDLNKFDAVKNMKIQEINNKH